MDKNTVILDLDRYNQLRDFETKMLQDYCVKIGSTKYGSYREYITESTLIKKLGEDVTELQKKAGEYFENIQELNKELNQLRDKCPQPKILGIEDIKKMSYWEFKKWKKSNL